MRRTACGGGFGDGEDAAARAGPHKAARQVARTERSQARNVHQVILRNLVTREDRKRMAAGSAGHHDLQVRLLSHGARVALVFLEAAETAPRRRRASPGRVFVHGTALYAGLARRPAGNSSARNELVDVPARRCGRCSSHRAPVRAERPIVDLHRLDAYFELFASDSNVPWKPTTVRLDTYSSAPVAFGLRVDPADVLTAGSNGRSRAIVTRGRRRPSASPLRRPAAINFNRTKSTCRSDSVRGSSSSRRGAATSASKSGSIARASASCRKRRRAGSFCTARISEPDAARAHARAVLVNGAFATSATDADGIVAWNRWPRPVFALAQWGDSYAFLSLLPQAPLPETIVAVRTDSAVVHAGDIVRVVGFARTRHGGVLRASTGRRPCVAAGATLAGQRVPLDEAGAFSASFAVPPNAAAGDYAVLAQAGGGVGGATVHVDADAGGLSLRRRAACEACDPRQTFRCSCTRRAAARRARHGRALAARVSRIRPATERRGRRRRGSMRWFAPSATATRRSRSRSRATSSVRPTACTSSRAARLPTRASSCRPRTPRFALHSIARNRVSGCRWVSTCMRNDLGTANRSPARRDRRMAHGASRRGAAAQPRRRRPRARQLSLAGLGTNLSSLRRSRRRARPTRRRCRSSRRPARRPTDERKRERARRARQAAYRAGDAIAVDAGAPGAQGDALITFESALGARRACADRRRRAAAHLRAADAAGELRIGAAFVRDGAIEWTTVPLALDAPGPSAFRARSRSNAEFAPATGADVSCSTCRDRRGTSWSASAAARRRAARCSTPRRRCWRSASPRRRTARRNATWHPWVDSTGDHAQVSASFGARSRRRRRRSRRPKRKPSPGASQRATAGVRCGAVPAQSGRYTLSVLDIADDGSVSAASSSHRTLTRRDSHER